MFFREPAISCSTNRGRIVHSGSNVIYGRTVHKIKIKPSLVSIGIVHEMGKATLFFKEGFIHNNESIS